ncbi:MAG: copper amine oxidase N-terminal domain-containing protein [Clostridia bacterium]|nr:copper amine oxidase N-terminal domain-containing protein [Clostridia bacterium]
MKKLWLFIVSILIVLLSMPVSFAAGNVIESPNVRIVIDGTQVTFSNTPVTVNERVMLPLREILTKLGVKDDPEHILWNDADKSVTIYKDQTKIILKVGQSNAFINDQEIRLDAAPVNYNSRVFIPVRFVSQSLGKKVVWDGATFTVFVREESEFNRTKEVLDKISAAMQPICRFKFGMETRMIIAAKEAVISGEGETDLGKQILHTKMRFNLLGKETITETVLAQNTVFSKVMPAENWQKKSISKEQFEKLLNGQLIIKGRVDTLAAGLVLQEGDSFGDLKLKGDLFIDDLFNQATASVGILGIDFSKMNLELAVDRNTYLLKTAAVTAEANAKSASGSQKITETIRCTYSEYNGDFSVPLPEDIKQ